MKGNQADGAFGVQNSSMFRIVFLGLFNRRYLRLRPSWRSRLAVRPIETFGALRINLWGDATSCGRINES